MRIPLLTLLALGMISGASWGGDVPTPRSAVTHHTGEFNGARVSNTPPGSRTISSPTRTASRVLPSSPWPIPAKASPIRSGGRCSSPSTAVPARPDRCSISAASGRYDSSAAPQGGPGVRPGLPASGRYQDNSDSLLDAADLVFIDPVSTGFSRAFPGENPKQWYSDATDAASVTQAIEHWLTVHHRWSSPRYLIGESYGTDRAGTMLAKDKRLRFEGVVLIALAVPADGRLIPYVTSLPTMAAGAWYHSRIARDGRTVEQVFDAAGQFARTDYLTALYRGSSLPATERARIAQRMSELIGLPAGLIAAQDLRIEKNTYMFNLLQGPTPAHRAARRAGHRPPDRQRSGRHRRPGARGASQEAARLQAPDRGQHGHPQKPEDRRLSRAGAAFRDRRSSTTASTSSPTHSGRTITTSTR